MKIAISGAQSTGKTTLINKLREIFPDFIFKTEITRELANKGFKINESGTDETQIAIMQSHMDRLKISSDVIYDRCILDGVVYTHYLFNSGKVSRNTLDIVKDSFIQNIANYDLIFYIKPEFDIVDDGERSINQSFRDEVVKLFEEYIHDYNIPVNILSGSVDERVKYFSEYIKNKNTL